MFILDDETEADEAPDLPTEIEPAALLAACAAEAERQAEGLRQLDAALGAALALARQPAADGDLNTGPSGAGAADGATHARALISALMSDLQKADRLRQEAEGLARALALLAGRPRSAGRVKADQVRSCTPVVALQNRLLVPPAYGQGR